MTCFTCNALVPDGAQTCPRCGAKLVAGGTQVTQGAQGIQQPQNYVAPWNRTVDQPRDLRAEKREFVLEATDSVKKTFFIRLGQLGIYVVSFILALMAVMSVSWGSSANNFVYDTLPKILTGANLILWVLLLIRFSDLQGYEERFGLALRYAVLVMLFSLAKLFFTDGIIQLLISIGELASGVLFMYYYCGSFSDITEMIDEGVSGKWNLMFKIYIGVTILNLAGTLILYFSMKNARTYYQLLSAVNNTILWALIVAILQLIVMVIEIIIFSMTVKCFENQR
jgi:hypothetical protein